jgi:hypothetical protein
MPPARQSAQPRKPPEPEPVGEPWRTTTIRMAPPLYKRLRRFVTKTEDETSQRLTHQDIFTRALVEFLTKNGGD